MQIADNISVNSIEGMKNALPGLRRKLNTDPVYFKKVYMHTFDLAKAAGARTLAFDTGKSMILIIHFIASLSSKSILCKAGEN
jgi:hypothetical protein